MRKLLKYNCCNEQSIILMQRRAYVRGKGFNAVETLRILKIEKKKSHFQSAWRCSRNLVMGLVGEGAEKR